MRGEKGKKRGRKEKEEIKNKKINKTEVFINISRVRVVICDRTLKYFEWRSPSLPFILFVYLLVYQRLRTVPTLRLFCPSTLYGFDSSVLYLMKSYSPVPYKSSFVINSTWDSLLDTFLVFVTKSTSLIIDVSDSALIFSVALGVTRDDRPLTTEEQPCQQTGQVAPQELFD